MLSSLFYRHRDWGILRQRSLPKASLLVNTRALIYTRQPCLRPASMLINWFVPSFSKFKLHSLLKQFWLLLPLLIPSQTLSAQCHTPLSTQRKKLASSSGVEELGTHSLVLFLVVISCLALDRASHPQDLHVHTCTLHKAEIWKCIGWSLIHDKVQGFL